MRRRREIDPLLFSLEDEAALDESLAADPKEFELKNIPEEERNEYLAALEIDNPSLNQEVFDLQEDYSYWLIDEMCVLSDGLFHQLKRKCEEWQRDSGNMRLRDSVYKIYELLNRLGIIDFPFSENPSQVLSEATRGGLIHGVGGARYNAMEEAHSVLGRHRMLEQTRNTFGVRDTPIWKMMGVLLFSGSFEEKMKQKREEAIKSVSHLIQQYKLFYREINKANGMSLLDGTTFDIQYIVNRFNDFTPPFDI
ncbi:MAG: hypothetical protein OEX81_03565 [Candidatus Pacebacteria bacterium]|nr:hypothetical protein [Candidatus Paceibacterota bacterium]